MVHLTAPAPYSIVADNIGKTYVLHHNRVNSLKGRFLGLYKQRWRQKVERFDALDGISFSVEEGESLAILGPNGAGKSSLLQIIAGIILPSRGTIATRGRITPLIELGVGFHPDLTGEENIYLNASLYGFSNRQIKARFKEIVEFSELGNFIDVPVKTYSSGMHVRLGFSVAIHLEPDILIADEILAVGDADFRAKCHDRIADMQRQGLTLLLVTHDLSQAQTFCRSYLRIEKGRVVSRGSFVQATSRGCGDTGQSTAPGQMSGARI